MVIDFQSERRMRTFEDGLKTIKEKPTVDFMGETVPNYTIFPSEVTHNYPVSARYNLIEDQFTVDIAVSDEAEVIELVKLLEDFKRRRKGESVGD